MSIDQLNTEAIKDKTSEQKSEIDSFLNQIEEPKKTWVNDVFNKDDKLKDLFERNLKSLNLKDRIQAKNDLLKCESPADILNFIKNHQGHKIGSSISEIDTEKKESTEEKEKQARENTEQAEEKEKQARENTEQAEKEENKARENTEQAEKEENKARTDTEQAREDTQQAREDTQQAREDTQQIKEKEEHKSADLELTRAIAYRQNLKNMHPDLDLDAKTGPGTTQYENVKQELEKKGVISKLKQDNHNEQFINNYILVKATRLEVKHNNEYSQDEISTFDKIVKNLDNACNIPDTHLSSFSKENIKNTRRELFTEGIGNESLIKARNNNVDLPSHKEAYEKMFPEEMGEDAIFVKYGQFLEGDLKKYWEQYKDNYKGFMDNLYNIREQKSQGKELTPEEENILKIPGLLKGIKEKFDGSAKNMIEEMCLITQINAMAKCIGQESFSLNKANDIKYDETGAMVLDGHIDGVDFSVRHNFDEDWSYLQTSSKLVKAESANEDNPENKSMIEIGGKGRFENSPFRLPGKESIFGMVSDVVASTNFSGETFNSVDDYMDKMQKGIVGKMDDVFDKEAKTDGVEKHMEGLIKKEKAIGEIEDFVKIFDEGSSFTGIVDNSNKKLYDFLNIMDFNIRNIEYPKDAVEMDKFIEVMGKINKMAELGKDNSNSSELSDHANSFGKYLTGDSLLNTRKILKNQNVDDKAPSAFDLFKNYKKDYSKNTENLYKIDFEQIDRTLNVVETTSAATIESNKSREQADNMLNEVPLSFWPPSPSENENIA